MIKVVAKHIVKKANIDEYIERAVKLVEETNKENGCIKYELCQDLKNPQILTMLEEWEDNACLDAHMNSAHFKEIVPILGSLVEAETDINIYKKLF